MTKDVITVRPDDTARQAAELIAERGVAALPVVDTDRRLLGIVAESDLVRHRIPADPRTWPGRDGQPVPTTLGLRVRDVMTRDVRSVGRTTDLSDVASLCADGRVRSLPVVEDGVLIGIVSRRDVLRAMLRPDAEIRRDVLDLVESYTGAVGCWNVEVSAGVAAIRRTRGAPQFSSAVEEVSLQRLAATVPGVTGVRAVSGPSPTPGDRALRRCPGRDGRATLESLAPR